MVTRTLSRLHRPFSLGSRAMMRTCTVTARPSGAPYFQPLDGSVQQRKRHKGPKGLSDNFHPMARFFPGCQWDRSEDKGDCLLMIEKPRSANLLPARRFVFNYMNWMYPSGGPTPRLFPFPLSHCDDGFL